MSVNTGFVPTYMNHRRSGNKYTVKGNRKPSDAIDPIHHSQHSVPRPKTDSSDQAVQGCHHHCPHCWLYAFYLNTILNFYCEACRHGNHERPLQECDHDYSTGNTPGKPSVASGNALSIPISSPGTTQLDRSALGATNGPTALSASSLTDPSNGSNPIVVDGGLSTVKGHVPDDDYAYLEKNDITVILNTNEQPQIIDASFNFNTSTCLIYSENVVITGTISLPGKNIGIFCSNLGLVGSPATIDVSGSLGVMDPKYEIVTSGPGHTGANGGNGGTIWMFVENLTKDIFPNLKLVTNGGDGSTGGGTSQQMMTGGTGGNGGNGGKITLTYGTVTCDVLQKVIGATTAPWVTAVSSCTDIIVPALSAIDPPLSSATITSFQNIITQYAAYAQSLNALLQALSTLLEPLDINAPYPSTAVTTAATNLQTLALAESKSVHAPLLTTGLEFKVIDTVTQSIGTWIKNSRVSGADARLIASMNSLSMDPNQTTTSALASALQNMMFSVAGAYQENLITAQYRICSVNKGNKGRGGPSGSAIPPGNPGTDGVDGTIFAKNLSMDGNVSDLDTPMAFAFPEQCRMLLNKADNLYFSNDMTTWTDAASYYQRLARRLAFVPAMVDDIQKSRSGSGTTQLSPLSQAYQQLEYTNQLTMSALSQLQNVYGMATKKLSRMAIGQDMFGHDPTWAPRLSINSYKERVESMLPLLQDIETQTEKYQQAVAAATDMTASVNQGLSSTRSAKAQADARIQLLTDDNGPMQMAAYQIVLYTPLLKDKRQEIQKAIAVVASDIQEKITFHPQDIIDALGMIAFCPTAPIAAVQGVIQGAGVAYKAWTNLTDSSGQSVNKDYVISQLATCGSTLDSLSEAYSTRDDGTLAVDDPGAMKIMASEDDITSLLDRFKSSIPDSDASALRQDLDDYMDLVNSRNAAVLQYNSALQMLQEAQLDSSYAAARMQVLGQAGLKIDPNLPAIAFWLTKMRDDLRLDIMQRLNYQDRAISYWGLVPPSTYGAPGPLRDYDALSLDQETLSNSFETALGIYADNIWSTWPVPGPNASGLFYQLTPGEVSALTRNGSVIVRIAPDNAVFAGRSNVRLSQVRIWVVGASVSATDARGRQPLMIDVTQQGRETILSHTRKTFEFTHDAVDIQFTYDSKGVKSFADCTSDRIFNTEVIQGDFSGGGQQVGTNTMAGIGPFAAWRIQIRAIENPGLAFAPGTVVYVEFWGGSGSFS